tara:strand:+ start:3920 stop:4141 length:222 start_codon:yes stop_codon:yes gene_type:complete
MPNIDSAELKKMLMIYSSAIKELADSLEYCADFVSDEKMKQELIYQVKSANDLSEKMDDKIFAIIMNLLGRSA